ncbi:hypothetical protein, partial [Streptomyces stelliscabiei]|uniref:hypothetical protein n=1 Tax=Streptomyces stelliscabiei TaxID=146820 RepID=UPI000AA781CC
MLPPPTPARVTRTVDAAVDAGTRYGGRWPARGIEIGQIATPCHRRRASCWTSPRTTPQVLVADNY